MSTIVRILAGIALMMLGFLMARVGCMVLVEGLYGGSIFSILAGILGTAMTGGGTYLLIKGWQATYELGVNYISLCLPSPRH